MKIDPSMRCARPLQKMLKPVSTLTDVCAPVAGSQTVGAREVLHRVGLGCVVADRVVGEHLPVGEQRDVHAHHRPVDDRAPLPDVAFRSRHRRGGRRSVGGGPPARDSRESRLLGDVIERHRVLRRMVVLAVRQRARGQQPEHGDRDDDGDSASVHGDPSPRWTDRR